MFDDWEAMAERRREEDAVQYERERRTLVQMLDGAGQPELALVVAASEYGRDHVDDWDGGQYEVSLGVPPEYVFNITDEHRSELNRCLSVIVGERHYRGLIVGARLAEYQPGWDAEFVQRLWARLDGSADAAHRPALP